MKLNISSDDINLLVYRYLIENGYCHTAFSFNKEASINSNPYYGNHADKIPPNALVSFMQKAMIYIYLEYHTDDITGEQILCEESFSFFRKHNCFRKLGQTHGLPLSHSTSAANERTDLDREQKERLNGNEASPGDSLDFDLSTSGFTPDEVLETNASLYQVNHPVFVGPPQRRLADKWQLYGYHKLFEYKAANLVSVCHFNPVHPNYILKRVENAPSSLYKLNESGRASICQILLPHAKLSASQTDAGVATASRWRQDGNLVASGHSDGSLNLWSLEGHLLTSLRVGDGHSPVTALAFSGSKAYWTDNPAASDSAYYLSSGLSTGLVVVYRVERKDAVEVTRFQQAGCVTDLEWQNHSLLVSVSTGGAMVFFDLDHGERRETSLQVRNSVPFMEWDFYGRYLAVLDDTEVVKVYKPRENEVHSELVELRGHKGNLVQASWYSGTNEKSANRLCTVAMDKQMIVWDVVSECSLVALALDQMPTTVAVCPNDTLVAIGAYGNSVKMYALPSLNLVCSFYDQTVPTNLSWSPDRQHLLYNVFNLQRALVVPLNKITSLQSD